MIINKVLSYFYIIVLILIIFFFQVFVVNQNMLFGARPNLILITLIVISLWYGVYTGTIFGTIIGFSVDLIFGGNGMFTISYTVVGALIGLLNTNYRKENKMSLVYVTIIATALFEIVQYIQYLIITHTYSNLFYLLKQILLSSLFNIIIVYILYNLVYRIIDYFECKLRREGTF